MTILYILYLLLMVVNPRIVRYIRGEAPSLLSPWTSSTQPPPSESKEHVTDDGVEMRPVPLDAENGQPSPQRSEMLEEGERPATPADGENGGDDDDGPKSLWSRITALLSKPMELALAVTIPDCRTPQWENWYMATFGMSIVWIGVLSFLMVDFATRAACVLHVPELVIGLVVLSVGTSVPDALSSIIVAKQGQGNMAVCNALGSNIFNILLGLGLPWWIRAAIDGKDYPVPGFAQIGEPLLLLVLYLCLFIGIIKYGRWKLSPKVGWALLACQAIYTLWTLARNLPTGHPIISFR